MLCSFAQRVVGRTELRNACTCSTMLTHHSSACHADNWAQGLLHHQRGVCRRPERGFGFRQLVGGRLAPIHVASLATLPYRFPIVSALRLGGVSHLGSSAGGILLRHGHLRVDAFMPHSLDSHCNSQMRAQLWCVGAARRAHIWRCPWLALFSFSVLLPCHHRLPFRQLAIKYGRRHCPLFPCVFIGGRRRHANSAIAATHQSLGGLRHTLLRCLVCVVSGSVAVRGCTSR